MAAKKESIPSMESKEVKFQFPPTEGESSSQVAP